MSGIINSTGARSGVVGTTVGTPSGGLDGVTTGSGNVTITNGNLIVGTSAKGIDFSVTTPDGTTVSSELLDDYEEGTWTPAFTATSGTIAMNTSFDLGAYTKVGRSVHVCGFFIASTVSSPSGSLEIAGLPFTVDNNTGGKYSSLSPPSFKIANLTGSVNAIQGWCNANASTVSIMEFTGTTDADCADHIQSSSQIFISLTYTT